MSLTVFNKQDAVPTVPNQNFYEFSYDNQATGSDQYLFISVCITTATSITTATYNGSPLTASGTYTQNGMTGIFGGLFSPSSGTNTVRINFSGLYASQLSWFVCSFNNCAGPGIPGTYPRSGPPNNQNLTVTSGSKVFVKGHSSNVISDFNVDGTVYTSASFDINSHSVGGNIISAKLSDTITTGGSIIVNVGAFIPVANNHIEIKQATTPPPSGSSGNFFLMF